MTDIYCVFGGTLVDADRTDGEGVLQCECGRWALTDPGPTTGLRVVERHRAPRRQVKVRVVEGGAIDIYGPDRAGRWVHLRLDVMQAIDAKAGLLGCLAAGHPTRTNGDHPVDAMEPW